MPLIETCTPPARELVDEYPPKRLEHKDLAIPHLAFAIFLGRRGAGVQIAPPRPNSGYALVPLDETQCAAPVAKVQEDFVRLETRVHYAHGPPSAGGGPQILFEPT